MTSGERSAKTHVTHLELHSLELYMGADSDDYGRLLSEYTFPRLKVLRLYATEIVDSALGLGVGRMKSLKRLELREQHQSYDI